MDISTMDVGQLLHLERVLHYVGSMRPLLNKKALFSDTTSDYVNPVEPNAGDDVTFRFRAGKNNLDMVSLIY